MSRGHFSRSPLTRFLREDERGVAAVETALIAPMLLVMLSIAAVGGEGFAIQRKVALASRTVTDLVARSPFIKDAVTSNASDLNQSDLDVDIALGNEILYPNATAGLQTVVSELSVNAAAKTGTVVWSEAGAGATKLPVGTVINLDAATVAIGAPYLIYGQVQYSYQPISFWMPIGATTLSASEKLTPRNAAQIIPQWGQ